MKTLPLFNSNLRASVDDADFETVSQFRWLLHSQGYVYRYTPQKNGKRTVVFLHSFLLGARPGLDIDHIDTNRLNHKRDNLRHATRSQNLANQSRTSGTSRYKGVSWRPANKKWMARIQIKTRPIYLGYFVAEEDAARAYDAAAVKYFGEFARLNFPQPKPTTSA